jgi:hypothetical protein
MPEKVSEKVSKNILAVKKFPPDLRRRARIRALEEGVTLREVIIAALTQYLESKPAQRTPGAP